MKEFCALGAKAYLYLMDHNSETENSNDKIMLKSQQRFKSDHHKVYTEDINKIALSSNDDNRL